MLAHILIQQHQLFLHYRIQIQTQLCGHYIYRACCWVLTAAEIEPVFLKTAVINISAIFYRDESPISSGIFANLRRKLLNYAKFSSSFQTLPCTNYGKKAKMGVLASFPHQLFEWVKLNFRYHVLCHSDFHALAFMLATKAFMGLMSERYDRGSGFLSCLSEN